MHDLPVEFDNVVSRNTGNAFRSGQSAIGAVGVERFLVCGPEYRGWIIEPMV
jgi:hypothetical protein